MINFILSGIQTSYYQHIFAGRDRLPLDLAAIFKTINDRPDCKKKFLAKRLEISHYPDISRTYVGEKNNEGITLKAESGEALFHCVYYANLLDAIFIKFSTGKGEKIVEYLKTCGLNEQKRIRDGYFQGIDWHVDDSAGEGKLQSESARIFLRVWNSNNVIPQGFAIKMIR